MIKAPFNFVPLSDKVYFPNWAEHISHDIPFEDGHSGYIDIEVVAQTPIFVRNGHTKEEGEKKSANYKSFSKTPDGKYFIPSTSIKGELRSILEILSFGKFDQIDKKRYSIRDLSSAQNKYMQYFQTHEPHCGWMKKDGDNIIITDNGIPGRLSLMDFYLRTGKDIVSKISDSKFLNKDSNKTACCKYKLAGNADLCGNFIPMPFNGKNPVDKRIKVKYSNSGKPGTIVFTGQPSARKKKWDYKKQKDVWSGKFYEFVFFDEVVNEYVINDYEDATLYKDFCFIYKDSEDWAYWKSKFNKGEKVPIFLTIDGGNLQYIGLSYLFKLPYPHKVNEYVYDAHKEDNLDLADCIFGDSNHTIKGRVQISHAICTDSKEYNEIAPYMGGPKPTFYPMYLKQNGTNGFLFKDGKLIRFKTMLDENAILKGWKRYPITKGVMLPETPEGQEDNTNPAIPLDEGSKFLFRINFHNLRDAELGSLLHAIELKPDSMHSIGFGKPLGLGSCKYTIKNLYSEDKLDVIKLKNAFSEIMAANIEGYKSSPQLRELFAMMNPKNGDNLSVPLEYMELKEFVNVKQQNHKKEIYGEYLQEYTSLIKRENKEDKKIITEALATVCVVSGAIRQARLIDGKDKNAKALEIPPTIKIKLKVGDKIVVIPDLSKNGNVQKLVFVRKL